MSAIAATGRSYNCLLFPGARMRLVVYLGEVLEIKVSVYLGRRYVGMAKKFLDPAQVVTRLQDMSRERVPEQVWKDVGVDSLAPRPVLDPSLHRAAAEARAAVIHEQRSFVGWRIFGS